ncbi:flagellar motor protein MotB [Sphingomonas sp. 10B4]|uniref:flagellar motor protein MotB n=1 Tax=unclassified Sphingomonas TaxID=196159 RepID=UPI002AB520F0|nr:flagellar motor protein MotB [Sphingomonas sp. 10B4]MDY7523584.1 flagellar motor protein MotB [Sphingomonas sp. 10B4]MEB0282871.1 flagellar motor protein MotB [Sphingomonas sp. 10B4]
MTAAAFEDALPELGSSRPVWLMTLADLALLLIGFFVFLQASQTLDRHALAKGLREGFGVRDSARTEPADPIAVSVGALRGFAPGSAVATESPAALIAWAREATRDRRVTLRIAGAVDGSPGDVDPVTGSGAMLAADRARAVATLLLVAHAVPADRLTIVSTARPLGRSVTVSTGFAGAGTRLPPGNPNLPPQRTPR